MDKNMKAPNTKSDRAIQLNKMMGEKIRQLRIDRGYSQMKFAEMLGQSQSVVSSWESGRSEPNVANQLRIADALGVPVSVLLPFEETNKDDDVDKRILDIIHNDPRWEILFERYNDIPQAGLDAMFAMISTFIK